MEVERFSKQIKEGTKKSHSAAENTGFVAGFLRGVVNKEQYRTLIANFYFVYRALEEEVYKLKDDPVVGKLYSRSLEREESLEKDCEYFYGSEWRKMIIPSDATQEYVNRIRELAVDNSYLLVGHHYTRYLGDLSGGQILKGIAQKALGLTDEGLLFYEFDEISDAKGFKESYRTTLDTLPLTVEQQDDIIEEANNAFRLNMHIFNELEGSATKSLLKLLYGYIRPYINNWKRST